jgi:hypothetical protein
VILKFVSGSDPARWFGGWSVSDDGGKKSWISSPGSKKGGFRFYEILSMPMNDLIRKKPVFSGVLGTG